MNITLWDILFYLFKLGIVVIVGFHLSAITYATVVGRRKKKKGEYTNDWSK